MGTRIKQKLLQWLRLTNKPVVRIYAGYGHNARLVVYGHTLALSPLPVKRFTSSILLNTFALLRLFMVRPYADALVTLSWDGQTYSARSESDGFFRIEWNPVQAASSGWHPVQVNLVSTAGEKETVLSVATGEVFVPHTHQFICISDIDDTFLISHSSNLRKRLYVLFTKNAHSRKPFEGVIDHYQQLAYAGTSAEKPNPFFYVSSSEWNLYDYILSFSKMNGLPKGVFLLSQMKKLSEIVKTGQNKHATKFMRIARIVESYPQQQYILFGDDSQEDAFIYSSIAEHFPGNVRCIYIRNVNSKNRERVSDVLLKAEAAGVNCFYFKHSKEAILHSEKIGLLPGNLPNSLSAPDVNSPTS